MKIIIIFIIAFISITYSFVTTKPHLQFNTLLNSKKNNRNTNIICNEKYIYKSYLINLRKVKKTIKRSSSSELINIINIITNMINNSNIRVENYEKQEEVQEKVVVKKDLIIDNKDFKAKKILLENIHIDVSNVKYVKISTINDTLTIELDKKEKICNNSTLIKYDLKKLEAFISAISILMNVFNIH
jgi:hypothetical protein